MAYYQLIYENSPQPREEVSLPLPQGDIDDYIFNEYYHKEDYLAPENHSQR